ncbi:hypothetical protein [Pelagicoccus sp. SDUM812005]|uniref:hypothetical protein n=1 Tax=Pelagicoccus sp. SDUM812005 TaxID=3041257 RepID=UPI00280D31C9|nr:hypothetical protein [Pelagicoccus sp. SDUM812005]MDQ8183727.1 hypothetical protein [Pelagicoccus sp. SDUM812005]
MTSPSFLKVSLRSTESSPIVEGESQRVFSDSPQSGSIENAVYSKWSWDGKSATLESDYSGFMPLFYFATSDCFIVSNSLAALLEKGADTTLDETALSVFARCGFFLGESTPFKSIKSIGPRGRVRWAGGKLDTSRGVDPITPVKRASGEIAEEYAHFASKAIQRRLPDSERFALLLTGGRDSRQILLELLDQDRKPQHCLTGGEYRDLVAARQLAEHLDLPFEETKSPLYWRDAFPSKNLRSNFCTLEHGWLCAVSNRLSSLNCLAFDGTGVGVLTRSELLASEYVADYRSGNYQSVALRLIHSIGGSKELYKNLCPPFDFLGDSEEEAVAALAEELKAYSQFANPTTAFGFWNWNRRGIAQWPYALANRTNTINAPLMDEELYRFVASIEPESISEQEPQEAAIHHRFPQYQDLPFYNQIENVASSRNKPLANRLANGWQRLRFSATHPKSRSKPPAHETASQRNRVHHGNLDQYLQQLAKIVS